MTGVDFSSIRAQFPVLVNRPKLVYLDSANTTLKPQSVIEAVSHYYSHISGNVHRASHKLGAEADEAYEGARDRVQSLVNAAGREEIIFVRNGTEAINLVARTMAESHLKSGDRVLITEMEHHANIVPWQLICGRLGVHLDVAPIDDCGDLIWDQYLQLLDRGPKLVGFVHVSHITGALNPVKEMTKAAKDAGALVLVDGAQSVPHQKVDVTEIGCDFFAFSGHKMYGPTGIGVLYGRKEVLDSLPPFMGGGDMIKKVTFERTTYSDLPLKFEAGTPHIDGGIGLAAAADFLEGVGWAELEARESVLMARLLDGLRLVEGVRFVGDPQHRISAVSFVIEGFHSADIGSILDQKDIAVRVGQHCGHPLLDHFGIDSAIRASIGCYTSEQDIERLVVGLEEAKRFLGGA